MLCVSFNTTPGWCFGQMDLAHPLYSYTVSLGLLHDVRHSLQKEWSKIWYTVSRYMHQWQFRHYDTSMTFHSYRLNILSPPMLTALTLITWQFEAAAAAAVGTAYMVAMVTKERSCCGMMRTLLGTPPQATCGSSRLLASERTIHSRGVLRRKKAVRKVGHASCWLRQFSCICQLYNTEMNLCV